MWANRQEISPGEAEFWIKANLSPVGVMYCVKKPSRKHFLVSDICSHTVPKLLVLILRPVNLYPLWFLVDYWTPAPENAAWGQLLTPWPLPWYRKSTNNACSREPNRALWSRSLDLTFRTQLSLPSEQQSSLSSSPPDHYSPNAQVTVSDKIEIYQWSHTVITQFS